MRFPHFSFSDTHWKRQRTLFYSKHCRLRSLFVFIFGEKLAGIFKLGDASKRKKKGIAGQPVESWEFSGMLRNTRWNPAVCVFSLFYPRCLGEGCNSAAPCEMFIFDNEESCVWQGVNSWMLKKISPHRTVKCLSFRVKMNQLNLVSVFFFDPGLFVERGHPARSGLRGSDATPCAWEKPWVVAELDGRSRRIILLYLP